MGITLAVINGDGAFLLYESASLTLKGVLDGAGSVEFRFTCIDAVVVDFAAISVFGMVIGAGFAPAEWSAAYRWPDSRSTASLHIDQVTVLVQFELAVAAIEHGTVAVYQAENRSG